MKQPSHIDGGGGVAATEQDFMTTQTIPMMRAGYMLDTGIFNRLMREEIDVRELEGRGALYVTHIQAGEIQATKDAVRRQRLSALFTEANSTNLPTEQTMWRVSSWDVANYIPSDSLSDKILAALDARTPPVPADAGDNNKDVWVVETTLRLGFTLITDSANVYDVAKDLGCFVIGLNDLLALPT
jgi:hypothetical protein